MSEGAKVGCAIAGVLGALLAVILFLASWTVIPNGHVGVVTSFGQVVGGPLEPGLSPVCFWRGVTRLSTQTQEDRESAEVPTKEGLTVSLEVSLLYSIDKERVIDLFKTVGPNFKEVVVMPQFRSALRGVTVKHAAADLYTAHRAEIEDALEKSVGTLLAERGIRMEKVLLRSIELPKTVKGPSRKSWPANRRPPLWSSSS